MNSVMIFLAVVELVAIVYLSIEVSNLRRDRRRLRQEIHAIESFEYPLAGSDSTIDDDHERMGF